MGIFGVTSSQILFRTVRYICRCGDAIQTRWQLLSMHNTLLNVIKQIKKIKNNVCQASRAALNDDVRASEQMK